jgi:hypothetical protein
VRLGRHPRALPAGVALTGDVAGPADVHGGATPHEVARRSELVGPARAHQEVALDAAGEAADQGGRVLVGGAQQQDVAGVGVRRPRLGVQVVAVVPDRDEAQVGHRCERRPATPDHDPPGAPRDGQEVAVARGRTRARGQHHVVALAEEREQRGVEARGVLAVGHAQHGSAAVAQGRGSSLGEHGGPVVAGGGRPHRARGAALGEVGQERCAEGVVGPGVAIARHRERRLGR